MSTPGDHREVLRYVHVLVFVVACSAALILGSLYHHYTVEIQARYRIEQYHIRTLMLAREISARVADLKSQLSLFANPPISTTGSSFGLPHIAERRARLAVQSISQVFDAVADIQSDLGEQRYQGTVERIEQRLGRVHAQIDGKGPSLAPLRDECAVLGLAVYQLDRLHTIALEETTRELADSSVRRNLIRGLVAVALLAVTTVVVFRLLAVLRSRLRHHLQTRQALVDRERKLQHAEKLEALGTLVGGIAHDFNNLLTAVLGYAVSTQRELPVDHPSQHGLREIQRAGERAAGLTRQLLAFSRSELTERRVIQLNLLIRDLEPLLRRLIPEDISFTTSHGKDLGNVEADPLQVEQTLINLVVNARDAMPDGGRLTIESSNVEVGDDDEHQIGVSPGPYCRLRVEDTGCGMSPDVQSRAFEPFFTTKEPGRGTGLGLSTVHGVVTKSGGHLVIESEPGRGTRVDVYLPHCHREARELAELRLGTEGVGGTETILVAEDDDQVRGFVEEALREAGYQVLVAANGAVALRVFRDHEGPIHLILSDVVMPELRGPEFVEQAREMRPSVGVVFMSGYTEEAVVRKLRGSESVLVPKPFKLEHLLEVIRSELDRYRERETTPEKTA